MPSNFPDRDRLIGEEILDGNWEIKEYVAEGGNGVVYKGEHTQAEVDMEVACKLMPEDELREGWKKEIEKTTPLDEHPRVVSIKGYDKEVIDSNKYVCIVSEFVNGPTLHEYIRENKNQITIPFIRTVLKHLLDVFCGMEEEGIQHDDLHARNVLLSQSNITIGEQPQVKVTDFGIGTAYNSLSPKDDYAQLGDIALELLEAIDKSNLDSFHRHQYDFLVEDFINKRILESDPTTGNYVRTPKKLLEILESYKAQAHERMESERDVELDNPFDYLSCEQMGDSFELIQKLYSKKFPGYSQVRSKGNTILTGPRGCGKTTILKNMALETKMKADTVSSIEAIDFIGVFYPCRDLYFTFHYMDEEPDNRERQFLIHYFSISLLREFIKTIRGIRRRFDKSIPTGAMLDFEEELSQWLTDYSSPPADTDLLSHLEAVLDKEKDRVGKALRQKPADLQEPETTIPIDLLPKICRELVNATPWGGGLPIFFLVDDYSLPKISKGMQNTLNDLVMGRWDQVYFKVSTESIKSIHIFGQSGKLVEESREYETVDLASYFIRDKDKRGEFLNEVINIRLDNTTGIDDSYDDITEILGPKPYKYTELAWNLRGDSNVKYTGFEILRDAFSGDISEILRIVRGMFQEEAGDEKWEDGKVELPISESSQDAIYRNYGGSFLNKIESVPERGPRLRQIVEKFGEVAHHVLMNETSKNQDSEPPKQAFRIDLRDSFSFNSSDAFDELVRKLRVNENERYQKEELVEKTEEIYDDLIKYGVFLADERGKSIRGDPITRLYMRRLLIPKFRLTPSQRDNIGMEVSDFLYLLVEPSGFELSLDREANRHLTDYLEEEDEDSNEEDEDSNEEDEDSDMDGE